MATEQNFEVTEAADGSVTVEFDDDQEAGTAGATGEAAGGGQEGAGGAPQGDARTAANAEAEEDRALDKAPGLSESEREAIRERRRQERHSKKQAQREREDGLRNELAHTQAQLRDLQERMAQQDQRTMSNDLAQLDNAIGRAQQAAKYYKGAIEEATKNNNGQLLAEATEKMLRASQESERLTNIKQQFVNQTNNTRSAMDPSVALKAQEWANRNKWYDVNGKDTDSAMVLAIDQRMGQEGLDPRTPGYWEELDRRVQRYLPHRKEMGYSAGAPQERSAGTPVAGSGRESSSAAGARTNGSTYQLSAARVTALKDAGLWDDPKARTEAIRRFREHDRAAAAQQQQR